MNALLTHDEAMLEKKLNAGGIAMYECSGMHVSKLRSNEFSCKALGTKLTSQQSYYRNPKV